MNTAIIMLGSNSNAEGNLKLAMHKLEGHFEIIDKSFRLKTEPIGVICSMNFHNLALKLLIKENVDDTRRIFKQIELEMGRDAESKLTGIIPIDIDLIFWNENLVHEDYNRFEYVQSCVNEIIDN